MDITLVRIYLLPRVPGVTNSLMRDLALSKNTNDRAICLLIQQSFSIPGSLLLAKMSVYNSDVVASYHAGGAS